MRFLVQRNRIFLLLVYKPCSCYNPGNSFNRTITLLFFDFGYRIAFVYNYSCLYFLTSHCYCCTCNQFRKDINYVALWLLYWKLQMVEPIYQSGLFFAQCCTEFYDKWSAAADTQVVVGNAFFNIGIVFAAIFCRKNTGMDGRMLVRCCT